MIKSKIIQFSLKYQICRGERKDETEAFPLQFKIFREKKMINQNLSSLFSFW